MSEHKGKLNCRTPKVSVLMAVYNGEPYLREAIDSILGQTFHDFEFLIVNDGSTDHSREVVRSYRDPRIRLIDNDENMGLTKSLNRGLKLARGEYIARQDADDISEPERLARQVSFLEMHPEVALLGTQYRKINAEGVVLRNGCVPCDVTEIRWRLLFHNPFAHSSVMLRRSAILSQVGLYNEALSYAQDYELWCRVARCLPVANLNQHLVKFRFTPVSMTATYGRTVQEEPLQIRIAYMRNLLAASMGKTNWDNEKQLCAMESLLFGPQSNLDPREVGTAVKAILRLQTCFSRYYKMERAQRRTHRSKVCFRLSRRIINLAYGYIGQDNYSASRQLLLRVFRLSGPIAIMRRHVRLWVKLLIGPILVKALRNLVKRCMFSQSHEAHSEEEVPLKQSDLDKVRDTPRYVHTKTLLFGRPFALVDSTSFRWMFEDIFERHLYRFNASSEAPFIIDGGANIGLSVLYFKRMYPHSRIVAFEPDEQIFTVLAANLECFGCRDVVILRKALWSSETVLQFRREGADAGRLARTCDSTELTKVETARLRDYLAEKVDFLKLDIEGAETEVLADCAALLKNVEHVFVEYHSFLGERQSLHEVMAILTDAGFRLYVEGHDQLRPSPFINRPNYAQMDMQLNIYAFRASRFSVD